jgi:thiol-disulfide isomerase/thioredoxin
MLSVSIGPLALPLAPLLLLAGLVVAIALARRLAPPDDRASVEQLLWVALLVGLLAARTLHLLRHAEAYAADPWAVLDLRDGGWHALSGWLAGGVWLLVAAGRRPAWRRALGSGAVAGLLVWAVAGEAAWQLGGGAAEPPDLALQGLREGEHTSLHQLRDGRPTVVNLWASWCGPCRAEMPLLARAQQQHRGVRFLFVNQGEAAAPVQAYLAREGLALHDVWLDRPAALGPAVGSRGLPTTLFLDASGRRVDAHFGVLNDAALRVRLQALGRGVQAASE